MKRVNIIGIPMDLGQNRRGVDMGPSAVRYASLVQRLQRIGRDVLDTGNIAVPVPDEVAPGYVQERINVVAEVCQEVYERGWRCLEAGHFALFVGGDHCISIGSVKAARARFPTLGVIWVDAHADFNTPDSSPSGNIHGMPVAVVTGEGADELLDVGNRLTVDTGSVVQVGVRDVDIDERVRLASSGINVFTMSHVDECGIAAIARDALAQLADCEAIHVSLDMDSLNPAEAPGVGTPVRGGLSYREAHLLMELLGASGKVCSADIVEVNPILDHKNNTAELAVELIASLLGKTIL